MGWFINTTFFFCCYIHGKQAIYNFDIGASRITLLVFSVFPWVKQYFKSMRFVISSTYHVLGLFFALQWVSFSIVNGNQA